MFNPIFKINAQRTTHKAQRMIVNQQGTALVVSLFMLVIMTAMGITATNRTIVEGWLSANYRSSKQAFYVAEAGLEFTRNALRANTEDWRGYTPPPVRTINVGGREGSYTITLRDATRDSIIVTSTGVIAGATSVVEALFSRAFSPDGAIITEGDLEISDDVIIEGSKGGVHSNSNLTISDDVKITGNASASGNLTIEDEDDVKITGTALGDVPKMDIPRIEPGQFASYADYQLKSGGRVYRKGSTVPENMPDGKWRGWKYSKGTWTLKGDDDVTPPRAMLYIEGNVEVSEDVGSANNPWETTLIATGNITLSDDLFIANYKNDLHPIGVQNLLFVAGGDIKISDDVTQTSEGIIAARGSIKVSDDVNLKGFIIANNATGTKKNEVSDDVTITYNGMASPFISDRVRVLSWRQVHN